MAKAEAETTRSDAEDDYFVNNILTLYYIYVSKMHFMASIYKFYLY
jgi:hypothetical protein